MLKSPENTMFLGLFPFQEFCMVSLVLTDFGKI